MFCARVKEFLSQNHIDFTDRDLTRDESALEELEKLDYTTTPITVIDGEVIVGFERAKLEKLLPLRLLCLLQAGHGKLRTPLSGRSSSFSFLRKCGDRPQP